MEVMRDESTSDEEERWVPVPYILTREDATNLRAGASKAKLKERVDALLTLPPEMFAPRVWEQVQAHLDGLKS